MVTRHLEAELSSPSDKLFIGRQERDFNWERNGVFKELRQFFLFFNVVI
jgi:hypothetical protein